MMCLVLLDLVGMVDLAMVDAAGVDVERMAQPRLAHHRAFEVPARRALAPGGVPFHLPLLARRGLAPYGEVAGVALARDRIDAGMSRVVAPAGKRAIIRHAAAVEIKAAFQFVAMGGRDLQIGRA